MKNSLILLCLLVTSIVFSQKLDSYKYAIVPSRFDFLSEKNEYRLNEFTKMVMEKNNFITFYDTDVLPKEVNPLNTVYVTLEKKSTVFTTSLRIILNNSLGRQLFTSKEGVSKEKEYAKAYYAALRDASVTMEALNHNYVENQSSVKEKVINHVVETFGEAPKVVSNPLYAQPIPSGFQLIDATPKVIMKIFATSKNDTFIAKKELQEGVVFKKGEEWFYEFYSGEKLYSEKLEIKF
jgi:hypothetical protein